MNRFPILLGTALALTSAAHAQTVSNTYTSTDGYGNITTTTIQGPAGIVGSIANGSFYSGYGAYANADHPFLGSPNIGYGVPTYGYAVPNYGYNVPGYYPGQAYYVPGYSIPLGPSRFGTPTTLTQLPQVIVTPSVPVYPGYGYGGYGYATNGYGGYGYGGYGYAPKVPCLPPAARPPYRPGFGSRTETVQGGAAFGRGALNVAVGGTTTRAR